MDQPGLKRLVDRERFKDLRLDHEEVKQLFAQHHEEFATWVQSHAKETASEITTENKAKFYVSQLLYNSVVISAQFATGGGIGLGEVALDSVVSPFVAKGISMVIGNEKVKQFETDARNEHHRSLAAIIAKGRDRFIDFVDEATRGLGELEDRLAEIDGFQDRKESLVKTFANGTAAAGKGEGE